LFPFKKKLTEEDVAKLKDQLIIDAGEFSKLINQDKAWELFVNKIQERINKLRLHKANTKLITADEETIKLVKLFEYQADILEWVIKFPSQFINSVNKKTEIKLEE
jgi:hypothetical protein